MFRVGACRDRVKLLSVKLTGELTVMLVGLLNAK